MINFVSFKLLIMIAMVPYISLLISIFIQNEKNGHQYIVQTQAKIRDAEKLGLPFSQDMIHSDWYFYGDLHQVNFRIITSRPEELDNPFLIDYACAIYQKYKNMPWYYKLVPAKLMYGFSPEPLFLIDFEPPHE